MPRGKTELTPIETVIPGIQELPAVQRTFVESLYQGEWLPADEATRYITLLSHPQTLAERIHSLIERLQGGYSVSPRTAQNPRVQLGWRTLQRFSDQIKPVLQLYDASLWVYGSMIFDDPNSLDFDLLVASEEEDYPRQTLLELRWADALNLEWDGKVGEEGHLGWLCMDNLRKHHQAIQEGNTEYVDQKGYYINHDFGAASVVLTGYPLVHPKKSYQITEWKREIMDTIPANPILATCVYVDLEDTLTVRKERRRI